MRMLLSVRRLTATIHSIRSSLASQRPPSCRFFPRLRYGSTAEPNSTTHPKNQQDPIFPLELLKTHGFNDTQLANLTRKAPWVSGVQSTKITKKLDYLSTGLGLTQSQLVRVVTINPTLLRTSLDKVIIPSIDYCESILGNRADVIRTIIREPGLLNHVKDRLATNVEVLKGVGVPDSNIAMLLLKLPRVIIQCNDRFWNIVNEVVSAGFIPSQKMFIYCIRVKSVKHSTWEKKVEALRSSGWTDQEAEDAFRTWPTLYLISEEKIKANLGFLMGVLKMRATEVLSYPLLMSSSLEKSLVPRCCVLNVLMARGLVSKDIHVPLVLSRKTAPFLKKFVHKYQDNVPQVLEAYQGKMKFSGFDHQR